MQQVKQLTRKRALCPLSLFLMLFLTLPCLALADGGGVYGLVREHPEFIIFALTLVGIAFFPNRTLQTALIGLCILVTYKFFFASFSWTTHLKDETPGLLNLFGLLLGFTILAKHFEESGIPAYLPHWLPNDWKGGFCLLLLVMVISSFLDNIAAALIGGAVAEVVYKRKVHIGFLAAIVAASNAGGAGSVVGDTTTTMIWLSGISPMAVLHAYVGSFAAILIFGGVASWQQDKYQPIAKDAPRNLHFDWIRTGLVAFILVAAIIANLTVGIPALGVWIAIAIGSFFRKTHWKELIPATKGAVFLLSLVFAASLLPVEYLPLASWHTTLGLGFLSAVFDNIPLTKLTLEQGGYDWGFLAYAVGFGGSMMWFGSSAGVALTGLFPEGRSASAWLKQGWHVTLGYVVGFAALMAFMGWTPHVPKAKVLDKAIETSAAPSSFKLADRLVP